MKFIKKIIGWILEILYRGTSNYGLSIIILTIIVKSAMTPLVIKQRNQMKQNAKIAPLIKELKEKYKNDQTRMSQELMLLYKKHQMNPLSGLLTSLIQPFIIIALYCVIKNPITYIMGVNSADTGKVISACNEWASSYIGEHPEASNSIHMLSGLNNSNFGMHEIEVAKQMFIHPEILKNPHITPELLSNITLINFNFLGFDLSLSPKFSSITKLLSFKLNYLGEIVLLFIPLISGITTYFSNKQLLALNCSQNENVISSSYEIKNFKDEKNKPLSLKVGQKQSKQNEIDPNPMGQNPQMMMLMSAMSALVTFSCPAGLGIYWITSNVFQMVQHSLIKKFQARQIVRPAIEGEV